MPDLLKQLILLKLLNLLNLSTLLKLLELSTLLQLWIMSVLVESEVRRKGIYELNFSRNVCFYSCST